MVLLVPGWLREKDGVESERVRAERGGHSRQRVQPGKGSWEGNSEEPEAGKKAHRAELARAWNFPGHAPSAKCERRERARTRSGGSEGGVGLRKRSKMALWVGWKHGCHAPGGERRATTAPARQGF